MSEILNERRYQVFVSSTFDDLQAERQKVLQAILELRAFPAGMELFPSADEDQWEFIKSEIDSSDYYIVIIAGKYGSIAKDGTSYTEKEYSYALQAKKPIMAFLVKELNELQGKQLESDPERRQKLLRFRDQAKGGKLVKFFSNPEELKSAVLMSLIHSFQLKPGEGWVRAKNARRLDDLEEVAALQRLVLNLERENESLRAARNADAELLSQGKDDFVVSLVFNETKVGPVVVTPPVGEFHLETNWDELFASCFNNHFPRPSLNQVKSGVAEFLWSELRRKTPDGWPTDFNGYQLQIVSGESWEKLIKKIRVQFLAVGLIEVQEEVREPGDDAHPFFRGQVRNEFWKLTPKGTLKLGLLTGEKREPPILVAGAL